MGAAAYGYLSIVLVLLQHSANPDLPGIEGHTALMNAAVGGHKACVKALLRAKANTELLEKDGLTALQGPRSRATRPSRSSSGSGIPFSRMKRTRSSRRMRRWPPGVRNAGKRPALTQLMIESGET